MQKPIAQINQIANGYLVQIATGKMVSTPQGEQPVAETIYCEDYDAVCAALKKSFPPIIIG